MSDIKEARPSFDSNRNPNVKAGADADDERDSYDPNKTRTFRRRAGIAVGILAATVTASVAGGLAIRNGNNGEAPRAQPTAAAGVAPGEKVAEPSASAETEVVTVENMNADNVPIIYEGETYNGMSDFEKALVVSAEEYPTFEEAIPVMIKRFNSMVNHGNTEKEDKMYHGFASADLQAYSARGVAQDLIDPAYENALFDEAPEGVDVLNGTGSLSEMLRYYHGKNIANWNQTEKDAVKYRGEFTIEPKKGKAMQVATYENLGPNKDQTVSVADLWLKYADNGDENTIGDLRNSPDGYDGAPAKYVDRMLVHAAGVVDEDGNWQIIGGMIERE